MTETFVCNACDYKTQNTSNYIRHNKSKNHIWHQEYFDLLGYLLDTNPPIDSNIVLTDIEFYCNHCNKVLSKKNKSTHFKLCIQLNQALTDARNKCIEAEKEITKKEIVELNHKIVILQKDAELDKLKLQTELDKLKKDIEIKDLKTEINALKQIEIHGNENNIKSNNNSNNITKINNNNNNKSISLVYIKNNYKNAPVYEDIMAKELTAEERKSIKDLSPMTACTKLIRQRCIENVDMDKRSLHCLDMARYKYASRIRNKFGEPRWRVDLGGEHILQCAILRIKSIYPTKGVNIETLLKNQQALQEIMTPRNKRKMLKEITRTSHVDASNTL